MFKKYQMVILTVLIPLVIYKIISLLFESSVIDAIVVENGIEVMAYCFIKSKIMTAFAITFILSFFLGILWGDYLTSKYYIKNSSTSEI